MPKKKRFSGRLYLIEQIVHIKGSYRYVYGENGTLFARYRKTDIHPEDLPEWFIYGRYYKRFGFLSAKGITDMVYSPSKWSNHFLKDDCLFIAYGGKITENAEEENRFSKYDGWNERVFGLEIMEIMKGAREYSNYDISSLIQQLKEKKAWLQQTFPDEFGPQRWDFDVDAYFTKPIARVIPTSYHAKKRK